MKSLASWQVFRCTDNNNNVSTVVIGQDASTQRGIIEPVQSSSDGHINDYKLFGYPNPHFVGFQELWTNYCTTNNINAITNISSEYKY